MLSQYAAHALQEMTQGSLNDGKVAKLPMARNTRKLEAGESLVMYKEAIEKDPTPLVPMQSPPKRKRGKQT